MYEREPRDQKTDRETILHVLQCPVLYCMCGAKGVSSYLFI